MTPEVQLALGALRAAFSLVNMIRLANETISAAGADSLPEVRNVRRRLAAEWNLASDAFERDALSALDRVAKGQTSPPEAPESE